MARHQRHSPSSPAYPTAMYWALPHAHQPFDRPIGIAAQHLRRLLTDPVDVLAELYRGCYAPTDELEACDPRDH